MSKTKNQPRVLVTGLGPVTSIGIGNDAFWRSLVGGRSAVAPRQLYVDLGREAEFHIASMAPALPTIRPHHEFLERNDYAGYRDLAYALAAIDLALEDAHLEYDRADNNIGVIQAFEAPGMERAVATMFETCATMAPSQQGPPKLYEKLAPYFYNVQAFVYVHAMSKAFGFHGYSTSVHNACTSGAFAVDVAAQRIRNGDADVMLVAAGEAFDTGVRIEWFRQLGLHAADGMMRPFDPDSSGFYVGEGAAAIVLESESSAQERGARPYAEYLGGAFAHQGWKHSIPDVRSSRLHEVIDRTMTAGGLTPKEIDLIVPHGAGTTLSDGYEAQCIAKSFERNATGAVTTAFKPHVGHTLAASAVIELTAALLSMRHNTVPGTLHSRSGCGRLTVPLVTETTERQVNTLLKLSTGFTGHDAAGLYRRVDA